MRDYEIRQILKQTKLKKYIDDDDSIVLDEMDVAAAGARVDIAVVNGIMHGYEIKSASDTLNRLGGQICAYSKVFDYITVVTETKHLDKINSAVPEWVGITLCEVRENMPVINDYRKATFNSLKESFFVANLLLKEDLLSLLYSFNVPFKKSLRNWLLCEIAANHIDIQDISDFVRNTFKQKNRCKLP